MILIFTIVVIDCLNILQFNLNGRSEQRNSIKHSLSTYRNSIAVFLYFTDAFLLFFAN